MAAGVEAGHALGVSASLTGRRWLLRGAEDRVALGIAQRLDLPEVVGRLLASRGIDLDGAGDFLAPTLRALLPDPSVFADMDVAAERLAHAARRGETVGVFGDYDVDGACSAAVIVRLLRALGCPVLTHVPDRLLEGYGPNGPALLKLVAQGASLIVCVDCGTAAATALAAVAGQADVVVLDHHAVDGLPPPVLATVNPNRLDCGSGHRTLCAAAVAFLAAVATVRHLRQSGWFATRPEPDLMALLDLVALATVCDVMPLTGLNRALVVQGLRVMARRHRPGLAALLDAAAAHGAPSAMTCGFALGPRINAAGRISDAGLGLRLLLTEDPVEAQRIALLLDSTNRERREVEAGMMQGALDQATALDAAGHAALLAVGEGWHPGVVGIVAGRLKERFNRPTLVGAIIDGVVKGSARSVPGVDLGRAIIAARSNGLLLTGGGHAMAAGFSLAAADVPAFQAFLDERLAHARSLPRAADLTVEGTLSVPGATVELAGQLQRLAPYGHGNEEPVFALSRARVVRADRIGKDSATVRAIVEGDAGVRLKAMLFRAGEGPLAMALLDRGAPLHLAGHLRAESWNGTVTPTFFVADAAPA
ncbi:MAG: single-stranded-DNA-specific exonuclease RecJ [Janthinobacterium lividum]